MKSTKQSLAFVTAAGLALGLTACGDDVTKVTEGTPVMAVETEANLPACNADNNGSFVIAKDKQKVFVCYSESWFALNSDGSPADSAKTAPKASDGKNGTNGTNGNSCTGVAFESGDSTGFKIVCGKDTLGVILNGKDGINGRSGRHAVVPGLANKLVKRMKRGINSFAFYSPGEGFKAFNDNGYTSDYGLWLEPDYKNQLRKKDFKSIADKGFDHIRFDIRWDTHFVGDSSKCEIDPEYMKQVRWAVDNTIAAGMIAVVEDHYLIFTQKKTEDANSSGFSYEQVSPCEKKIYRQIIDEMKDISPDSLVVELPNEPTTDPHISAKQWNNLVDSLIQVVHGEDPARVIIVGGRNFYNKDYLNELHLNNPNGLLMASFHYYEPYDFTGGGCETTTKIDTSKCGNGKWAGSKAQKKTIYNDFEQVALWSKARGNMPIYLGEFGVRYYVKDVVGAEKWLSTIVQTADHFGFAMAVFSFDSDTYLYHFVKEEWVDYKLRALFDSKEEFAAPDLSNRPNLDTISKKVIVEDFGEYFPKNKLFADLGKNNEWYFYNSCQGRMTCDTIVTTNEAGTRSEIATMASFKTTQGHNGNGLYMKHVVNPPEKVYPYYALDVDLGGSEGDVKDLSNMKAVSFWAKGQGKIMFVLQTKYGDSVATANGSWKAGFYEEYSLSDEWTRYEVWPDALLPERYSVLADVDAEWDMAKDRVYKIEFKNGSGNIFGTATTVEWYIDDITIHGMSLSDFQ